MAFQFLDTACIDVTAGRGGDGCHSFRKEPFARNRRPDGGHGGDGGDVWLRAEPDVVTLLDCAYRKHYRAARGVHGQGSRQHGARGADCLVRVPVGTVVRDAATGQLLRDLDALDCAVRVARGGAGGRGNARGKAATPGAEGESRTLALELKLIADIGLVGLPNAGKSSLLQQLSSARPKIAAYPFTTISPHLGVTNENEMHEPLTVCDIPGLIAGAHRGKGLGLAFLRHVERTRLLVYVVDVAGTDARRPVDDVQTLRKELTAYAQSVGDKPHLIAANKMDLPEAPAGLHALQGAFPGKALWPISCATGDGISALIRAARQHLTTLRAAEVPGTKGAG